MSNGTAVHIHNYDIDTISIKFSRGTR